MNRKTGSIRMKRLYGILLTLPLLLGACSGEESTGEYPQENKPIGFSGDVPLTKAAKEYATTDNLKDIGVFAYFTNGDFNESTATPNFMYNQLVEKQSDNSWTYTPIKYWPANSTTDKISFFAYAPYVKESQTGGSNPSFRNKVTTSGCPVLDYTAPAAEKDQIDFLAATPVMNQNDGNVSFKLYHTLTKVNIYIKSDDNTEGKTVTNFSITGIKSGILSYYPPATVIDKGWKWTFPSPAEKETFTADNTNFAVPNTVAEGKKLYATFFLLPNGEGSQFSITYQYTTKDKNGILVTQTINMENRSLPSTSYWTPGAPVSYTIGIARKTITVTPENGPISWEEDTESETVNGKEEVTGS